MASKFPVDIEEDEVTCSICQSVFEKAKGLPCFHGFCERCIVDHIERTQKYGQFQCPICREESRVPVGGVNALKDHFLLNNLADKYRQGQAKISGGTGEPTKPCGDDIESRVDNLVASLDLLAKEDGVGDKLMSNLNLFDTIARVSHDVWEINEARIKFVENERESTLASISKYFEVFQQVAQTRKQKLTDEVNRHTDELRKKLDQDTNTIKACSNYCTTTPSSALNYRQTTSSEGFAVQNTVTHVRNSLHGLKGLNCVRERDVPTLRLKKSSAVPEFSIELYTSATPQEWRLAAKCKLWSQAVLAKKFKTALKGESNVGRCAITHHNTFVVVDPENKKAKVFGRDANFQRLLEAKHGRPIDVAANDNGTFVLFENRVAVYDKDFNHKTDIEVEGNDLSKIACHDKRVFVAGNGKLHVIDIEDSGNNCVIDKAFTFTRTTRPHVAIQSKQEEMAFKSFDLCTSRDGDIVSLSSQTNYIETYEVWSGRSYTDPGETLFSLYIVDSTEYNVRHVYVPRGDNALKCPRCVCCDELGHVIILDVAGDESCSLHVISKTGELLVVIPIDGEDKPVSPTGMTISAPGELAIVQSGGEVKVYKYMDV